EPLLPCLLNRMCPLKLWQARRMHVEYAVGVTLKDRRSKHCHITGQYHERRVIRLEPGDYHLCKAVTAGRLNPTAGYALCVQAHGLCPVQGGAGAVSQDNADA